MRKSLPKTLFASALMASFFLSSCASVKDRFNIPFLGSDSKIIKKKDDGRITVLGVDDALKADPSYAATIVTAPAMMPLNSWDNASGPANVTIENIEGDGKLGIFWRKKVGSGGGNLHALIAPPIIGDNKLFVIDSASKIHALSLDNGKSLWNASFNAPKEKGWFKKESKAVSGGLGYENSNLIASSGYGELINFDANNGAIKWRLPTTIPVHASPLLSNGRAYVVLVDSQLLAIDANNGNILWKQSSINEPARVLSSSTSVIQGDSLVTPFASGEIISSLVLNGRKLWSEGLTSAAYGTSLSSINDIAGHPTINNGVVYAASQSGILAAIDLRSGVKIWEKPIPSVQSPWVAGDFVYIVSTNAELVCLDKATGSIVWIKQLDKWKNAKSKKSLITWSGPVMVASRLVLASSEGNILELSIEKGEILNSIKTREEFLIAPAIANGVVYFYTNKGEIVALK